MERITIFYNNFDLEKAISINNVDSLDIYEDYLDFAIHSTIRKQKPDISIEQEKYLATVLLNNYLNGNNNSFTASHGIRKNISKCGRDKVIQMLMKEAIERSACEESIYHEIKTDSDLEYVCADITTKLIYFKYEEIMGLIENNPEYQKNLIENYVKLKYCSNIKEGIYKIRESVPKSIFALNSLESVMKSNISIKSKGEKGNELQFIDGRRNF